MCQKHKLKVAEGKQRCQSIDGAFVERAGEILETAQKTFSQYGKVPMLVRTKSPGIRTGVKKPTKVRESEALVQTGPDRIHHVGDLLCRGPVAKFHQKVIEMPCDTNSYVQVLSDVWFIKETFGTSYD